MVKKIMLNLLGFLLCSMLFGQDSICFKGKRFKGVIFKEDHMVLLSIDKQQKRYTPSEKDVLIAEKLLRDQIRELNVRLHNQGNGCPIIHKNLKKYLRQYVGFLNTNNEKIIWINFIYDDSLRDMALKDVITVYDGCSYHWDVKVNLAKNKLFDLTVNGR